MSENNCIFCTCDTDNLVEYYEYSHDARYRLVPIENYICEGCYDSYIPMCSSCINHFYIDYVQDFRGEIFCNKCFRDNTSPCENCGEYAFNDELDGDNNYCESCRDNYYHHLIHDYSYKPEPTFFGGAGIIKYGVELEVTTTRDVNKVAEDVLDILDRDHVYLKEDGSIEEPGFEIVSHPHTLEAHRKLWTPEFFSLPLKESPCNGMHVHIQRLGLRKGGISASKGHEQYQIAKMLQFINDEDNNNLVFGIAGRRSNGYALVHGNIKAKHGLQCNNGYSGKYNALNTSPARTVELRIFASTIKYDKFFSNLEFCDALVSFSKYSGIGGMKTDPFVKYVIKYRKIYKFLYKELIRLGFINKKVKTANA